MVAANLPHQLTSFVGRTDELREIVALLADPACRLLTLVGPGGIGKTRLAIQAAEKVQHQFADGVWFAALQPVMSTAFLVPALADALDLRFYGPEDPRIQLLHQLRDKELLLVVDNFEHLLDDVELLIKMLETAPRIKLLVTSRETLNVREEWVREVTGLRVPDLAQSVDVGSYEAVQLFVARARQARGDFELEREYAHVVEICRLVDGLPLAIELAATRVRTMWCEQIASELRRSMAILETTLRNVPERHRDIYAVFEPCWDRLTQPQRDAFMRLFVFRGGFTAEAAAYVADASLSMLAVLVDKSLLRVTPPGRYEMHELVRQYAEARLAEVPGEIDHVRDRHCDYYTTFLHNLEPAMKSSGQLTALSKIEVEIDNVRAAWRWAVGMRMEQAIEKSLESLALFYHIRSWYPEAEEAFQMVTAELRNQRSVVLGRALMWQGHFLGASQGGEFRDRANLLLQEGTSVLCELNAYGEIAMPLWLVSEFNDDPEKCDQIEQFLLDSLEAFRMNGDRWGTAWALLGWGNVPLLEGAYDDAQVHFEEAMALSKEIGDPLAMAASLQALIKVSCGLGAHHEAKRYAQEALTLAKTIDDRGGILAAQTAVGRAAGWLGDYEEAKQLLEDILPLSRELSPGNVWPIVDLGCVTIAMGDYGQARRYLYEALQPVSADTLLAVWAMIAMARLCAAEGQSERAVELLAAAIASPSGNRCSSNAAVKALFAELEANLPSEVFVAARRRGETRDLKTVAAAVIDDLAASVAQSDRMQALDSDSAHQIVPSAFGSLTLREHQVLRLVAEGLSNREIAEALVVTVGTVKKHLNNIFSKLHVRSRTEAVVQANKMDLLI